MRAALQSDSRRLPTGNLGNAVDIASPAADITAADQAVGGGINTRPSPLGGSHQRLYGRAVREILVLMDAETVAKPIDRRALHAWFSRVPGREIALAQRGQLDRVLSNLFGYHLVQVGSLGDPVNCVVI